MTTIQISEFHQEEDWWHFIDSILGYKFLGMGHDYAQNRCFVGTSIEVEIPPNESFAHLSQRLQTYIAMDDNVAFCGATGLNSYQVAFVQKKRMKKDFEFLPEFMATVIASAGYLKNDKSALATLSRLEGLNEAWDEMSKEKVVQTDSDAYQDATYFTRCIAKELSEITALPALWYTFGT